MIPESIIRTARVADLETFVKLEKESFPADALTKKDLHTYIKKAREGKVIQLYVIEDNNKVAGMAILYLQPHFNNANLDSLAVFQEFQGKKLGAALLLYCEEQAKSLKCTTFTLTVRTNNTKAIDLYERNGFLKQRTIKRWYKDGSDAYLMKKDI